MRRLPVLTLVVGCALLAATGLASASNWGVAVSADNSAEAQAQGLPAAPTSVSAACTSNLENTITLTWSAVSGATSYAISESSTSASSGYSSVARGVTGTSWTSPALSSGNYWFEVGAVIGSNWAGARSSATAESTITSLPPTCTQP